MPETHSNMTASRKARTLPVYIQFAILAGCIVPVALGCTVLLGLEANGIVIAFSGYVLGVAIASRLLRRGFPHPTLGTCNFVTLTRLALSAILLASLTDDRTNAYAIFAIAALALTLDGVDGWLARKEGRVSDFGARFDMEVDSALALILALNAWSGGNVGALVLVIGLPRYAFAAAGAVWAWLDQPLPQRLSRKAVCVAQISALMVLQLPMLSEATAQIIVVSVAAALLWSFGRDVAWLWRLRA